MQAIMQEGGVGKNKSKSNRGRKTYNSKHWHSSRKKKLRSRILLHVALIIPQSMILIHIYLRKRLRSRCILQRVPVQHARMPRQVAQAHGHAPPQCQAGLGGERPRVQRLVEHREVGWGGFAAAHQHHAQVLDRGGQGQAARCAVPVLPPTREKHALVQRACS